MLMQDRLEFNGVSGKVYTFEVYPKSAQLPETGGIYILTYSHPRGHLSGFQVNILGVGMADNLNSAITDFRQEDSLLRECWNYTCIICLDETGIRHEYLEDLYEATSIQC